MGAVFKRPIFAIKKLPFLTDLLQRPFHIQSYVKDCLNFLIMAQRKRVDNRILELLVQLVLCDHLF